MDALLSDEVDSCEKGENWNFRFVVPVVNSHVYQYFDDYFFDGISRMAGTDRLWNYFSSSVKWSKSNIMAWVYAAFLIASLLWINWRLFYRPKKFKVIREWCEKMGRMGRVIGQYFFGFYIVGSPVAFMTVIKQKFQPGDKEYRGRLEEIRELKSPLDHIGELIYK